MSTDRELLELAAKALGYELYVNKVDATQLHKDGQYVCFWNPLINDADALRLAAALTMNLYMGFGGGVVAEILPDGDDGGIDCKEDGADFMAAVRRAIVRAAAEIGRSMP
ncbi:hypothetical protein E8E95_05550 [Pseudomonas sp. BN414]|uniref:hypothetical protein n=1 Tax=Pseudomonas sp. BN414 TaxID=2567888 RepID=UPI002457AE8D|nr:hypothetical protein [Pseudomonas sp. BN414]MDH4566137.1 hypothetical protein [Pseudomonas sp. BN414]